MRERTRAREKKLTAGMFVRLRAETANRVRRVAMAEKRPASALIRILVEEALSTRSDRNQGAA